MANLSATNKPQQANALAESMQTLATLTAVVTPPPTESGGKASTRADFVPTDQYEVKKIIGHILDEEDDTAELLVVWATREITHEPEYRLMQDCEELVYEYWARKGGRCEATGFTTFYVHALIKHATVTQKGKRELKYYVHWVGYPKGRGSWEPADKIRDIAPLLKNEYDLKHNLKRA